MRRIILLTTALILGGAVSANAQDWTGGYVGAQLGYGDVSGFASGDGLLGGVHAGYNYDFGAWVLGGELDYDFANIDVTGGTLDDVARAKLRAGVDLGSSLLYATAGYAHAGTSLGNDSGYFAGIGLSYALSNTLMLSGEVLEHRFNDFGGPGADLDATTLTARISYRF